MRKRREDLMRSLFQDLRFAVRQMAKAPGFTIAAIITLTVGIGTNVALFSSMDAVVLRPLAVPRLDRVVTVDQQQVRGGYERPTLADYEDWVRSNRSFERLAIRKDAEMTLTGAGDADHVVTTLASANFFPVLGAAPRIGRVFNDSECRTGRDAVAVLNYGFWQRRFAGDANVLGRTIELDQRTYTIIGVMPKTMQFPSTTDVYLPFAPAPEQLGNRTAHDYLVIGRLRDGVSMSQAREEMRALGDHLAAAYPNTNQDLSIHVEQLLASINGPYTPEYYKLVMGATLFLLLVVCANVANLQLARGVARRPEIAMRTALGASRWRVLRQLLTENLLLALAGTIGAVGFAVLYLRLTLDTMPARVARYMAGWSNISLNGHALLFSLLLAGIAGVVAGLSPAMEALRVNLVDQLKAGSRSSIGSGRTHRLRNIFAVAQIALAVMLVIGAALMSKGMNAWLHIADFYAPQKTLTFGVTLPEKRYDTAQKRADWYAGSLERLRALPGVQHVELNSSLPYSDMGRVREVEVENRSIVPGKFETALDLPVSAGYFDALRIPIVAGRGFSSSDTLDSRLVAIVSERFAAQYFPGMNPLGHRVRMGGKDANETWLTIVGVAKETEYWLWDPSPHAAVYVDASQMPPMAANYLMTTSGDPLALAPEARKALAALDPALPLNYVETYAQQLHESLTGFIYVAAILAFDALFALFLSAIGIFAVMANLVGERTREIGVRLAMGARREDVLGMILGRAGKLIVIGLVSGLALAFALAEGLANMLHGVRPNDPVVFIGISGAITVVALVSSWLPALRAARVDPLVALRDE
jgi:putative ABC transport system permease protein